MVLVLCSFTMLLLEVIMHEIPSTLLKQQSSAAVTRKLGLEQICPCFILVTVEWPLSSAARL